MGAKVGGQGRECLVDDSDSHVMDNIINGVGGRVC